MTPQELSQNKSGEFTSASNATPHHRLKTVWLHSLALLLVASLLGALPAAAQNRGAKPRSTPGPVTQDLDTPIAPATPTEPQWGAQALDAIVLRPMGVVATAGGIVFFALTSPLAAISTATDFQTSWDVFVQAPWEFTFDRPLGDL